MIYVGYQLNLQGQVTEIDAARGTFRIAWEVASLACGSPVRLAFIPTRWDHTE